MRGQQAQIYTQFQQSGELHTETAQCPFCRTTTIGEYIDRQLVMVQWCNHTRGFMVGARCKPTVLFQGQHSEADGKGTPRVYTADKHQFNV